MKLEDIGFQTMYDERVRHISEHSEMKRCEIVLTSFCSFHCPYCNGIREDCRGSISVEQARRAIDLWTENGLENLRFTGGEPTLWKGLTDLVKYAKRRGARTIGISTNAYTDMAVYDELIDAGVDSFSISLDAADPQTGDRMSGVEGSWVKVTENIRHIAARAYVALGIVATARSVGNLKQTIEFALSLGVQDIKLISASQYNEVLSVAEELDEDVFVDHPFLRYRVGNIKREKNMRGLGEDDSHRCTLVLDDSSVAKDWHFPCTIYLREYGDPIGRVGENMRHERAVWARTHDTHEDPICSANCIDACIEFNNRCLYFRIRDQKAVPVLEPDAFPETLYREDGLDVIGAGGLNFKNAAHYRETVLHNDAFRLMGIALCEDMPQTGYRAGKTALLYEGRNGERFWFTIRSSELDEML